VQAHRGSRQPPLWLYLLAAAACAFYFAAETALLRGDFGFPLDDSWIHLEFARNLAHGAGLSYNPGEPVNGTTAPLWSALVSLVFWLPGNVIVWVQALGSLFFVVTIDATWRLARELGLSRQLASYAAALTLATSWLVWSALSGMEVTLFTSLSVWGMVLHLRERSKADGVPFALGIFALAALARPEGLLLLLLAIADRSVRFVPGAPVLAIRRPRPQALVIGALFTVCTLAAPLLYYRWSGGSFLPTTYAVKTSEVHRLVPNLAYLYTLLSVFFRPQPIATLLAGAGVVAQLRHLGTDRDRGLLVSLWVVLLPLAYAMIATDRAPLGNFGRYYFPLFPPLVLLAVLGLEPVAARLSSFVAVGQRRFFIGPLLALLVLAPSVVSLIEGAGFYTLNVINVQTSDVQAARWLAPRLDPAALLAVNDIGAFKYLLPNRIVDLAGIANPEILHEIAADERQGLTWPQAMMQAIARRHPDYIAVFPKWLPMIDSAPRFQRVLSLRIDRNVTMGANELAIYSTPWTRYPLRGEPANVPVR
jgi:hypothetical protein